MRSRMQPGGPRESYSDVILRSSRRRDHARVAWLGPNLQRQGIGYTSGGAG
jgi:hypothetical protein